MQGAAPSPCSSQWWQWEGTRGGHPMIPWLRRGCLSLPSVMRPITFSSAPRLSLSSLHSSPKIYMLGRQGQVEMEPHILLNQVSPGSGTSPSSPCHDCEWLRRCTLRPGGLTPIGMGALTGLELTPGSCSHLGSARRLRRSSTQDRLKSQGGCCPGSTPGP